MKFGVKKSLSGKAVSLLYWRCRIFPSQSLRRFRHDAPGVVDRKSSWQADSLPRPHGSAVMPDGREALRPSDPASPKKKAFYLWNNTLQACRAFLYSLLVLCLLSGSLSAQNAFETCLEQAKELADFSARPVYQPFLTCALQAAKSNKDSVRVYYELGYVCGDPATAHALLDTAIILASEDDIQLGKSWHMKGWYYSIMSNYIQAEKAYQEALKNYEQNNAQAKRIADCSKDLGNIYTRFSDYEKSISYLQRAVNKYKEANLTSRQARAMADLAWAYYYEDDIPKALQQAKSILKVPNISPFELGLAKEVIGACLSQQKAFDESILITREATQHFLSIGFARAILTGYKSLGETYLELGEIDSAKVNFQRAWFYCQEAYGNQPLREVGKWYIGWGKLQEKQHNWDDALQAYQHALYQCLPTIIDTQDVTTNFPQSQIIRENVLIEALEGKAKCWIEKYKQSPEERYLHLAIDALDLLYAIEDAFRSSYDFESSRLIVGALRHPRVEMSLWAISQLKDNHSFLDRAFSYVESSKALGLLEELKNDQSRQSVLPEAAAFQWNVQEKEIQKVAGEFRKNPSDSLQAHLRNLRDQHAQFINSLEQAYPEYYQFKYNYATIKPDQLIAGMSGNQTFIEYFYGDEAIYAFKVSSSGLELFEFASPDSLAAAMNTLERSLRSNDLQAISPAQYAQAAHILYQQLLAPLGELSARLTIIPDRALARIPFDALIAQQPDAPKTWQELPYLIQDKSIAYAWSATLLHNQQETTLEREGVLSINPVHFQQLPHLTAGQGIGPQLQQDWHKTSLLEEADATKANFLQHLQNAKLPYKILNLYTHAKADSLSPSQSWISFRDDQPDALLYLNELYHLQLNAQLAVLGACETGIGKEYRGEGLMSFARGFAYAGCQSILSTLWSSDEQATASLLQNFFSKLKGGEAKDVALADSKRDFLAATSERTAMEYHPRLWASLMVIGDSQAMGSGGFAWWWGLGILLAVGLLVWILWGQIASGPTNTEK